MPHIHKKIDFTVEVYIVYKNKVLLRKHEKYGMMVGPGGHIELDEDPNEAIVREAKEEVGLDISLVSPVKVSKKWKEGQDLIPPFFLFRHRIDKVHEHISLVYFAKSKSDKIKPAKGEEKMLCKWYSAEELKKDKSLRPNIRHYALRALKW